MDEIKTNAEREEVTKLGMPVDKDTKSNEKYFDIPGSQNKILRKNKPDGEKGHDFYFGSDDTHFDPITFYHTPEDLRNKGYDLKTGKTSSGENILAGANFNDNEYNHIVKNYAAGNYHDNPLSNVKNPVFDTKNGPLGIEYKDGKLFAGGITNVGPMRTFEVDYDPDISVDENLQNLYEKIMENPDYMD